MLSKGCSTQRNICTIFWVVEFQWYTKAAGLYTIQRFFKDNNLVMSVNKGMHVWFFRVSCCKIKMHALEAMWYSCPVDPMAWLELWLDYGTVLSHYFHRYPIEQWKNLGYLVSIGDYTEPSSGLYKTDPLSGSLCRKGSTGNQRILLLNCSTPFGSGILGESIAARQVGRWCGGQWWNVTWRSIDCCRACPVGRSANFDTFVS